MTETLTIRSYVGAEAAQVDDLLVARGDTILPLRARRSADHFEVEGPGSVLDGATITTAPVGPHGTRLTEITVRLREPFEGADRSVQFLEASRFIGEASTRLASGLKPAC
jgi:hypothetical protein